MGTFFDCCLSYDRDKKKTNVNNCPKRRYLRTLIFCTSEFVQVISGRFFYGQTRRRTFPLSSVHSDVSNDYEGRQLHRRSGWSLCSIARDSHGERKR